MTNMIDNENFIIENGVLTKVKKIKAEMVLPEGVTTISKQLFEDNYVLKKIVFPSTLERIDNKAFACCSNLREVIFNENLKYIGVEAFLECEKLKGIKLPDSLEVLENGAFYGCCSIEEVTIPSKIDNISNQLFVSCESLKSVKFNGDITSIGYGAFSTCSALEEIIIPPSVKKISDLVFYGDENLRKIELPPNLQKIGNEVFVVCYNLESINIPSSLHCLHSKTFDSFMGKINIDLSYYSPSMLFLDNTDDKYSEINIPNIWVMDCVFYSFIVANISSLLKDNMTDAKKEWINYFRSYLPLFIDLVIQYPDMLSFLTKYKCLLLCDVKYLINELDKSENTAEIALLLNYEHNNFDDKDLSVYKDTEIDEIQEKFRVIKYEGEDLFTISLYLGEDEEELVIPSTINTNKIYRVGPHIVSSPRFIERDMPRIRHISVSKDIPLVDKHL